MYAFQVTRVHYYLFWPRGEMCARKRQVNIRLERAVSKKPEYGLQLFNTTLFVYLQYSIQYLRTKMSNKSENLKRK